jgi:ferredoxin, 2Fe-2S
MPEVTLPTITFIQPDGTSITATAAVGASVMDAALDHQVPGILAQCGGGCTCATCHCYVIAPATDALPAPHPDELDMLHYVWQRRPNSRLACQIRVSRVDAAIVVEVPERQA